MPKFLDYHATMPHLPPEAVKMMSSDIKAGKKDQLGVKGLNVFMGGGHGWCLTEAPNAQAVCKSHEAKGIKLGVSDVTEVQSLV